MKNRVLLVKIDKKAGGSQNLSFSEPIGICYISSYLKENGIDCCLLHVVQDDDVQTKLDGAIKEVAPTFIGFSVRNFNFRQTCTWIRKFRLLLPDIVFCIGGECITEDNVIDLLEKSQADVAIISDGEEALLEYLRGTDKDLIPGIAYRNFSTGKCVFIPHKTRRVDPARLPMMDRDGLPMSSYQSDAFPGKKYATMHVQRGCRYKCTFCHTACRYKEPMSRTCSQIIEEIDFLCRDYQIEALAIWDEDFFANIERAKIIARSLIERGSPIEWQSYMKLTDLKKQEVKKILPVLKKSGYARAIIGIESFIPETLRRYHKVGGPSIEESLQSLTRLGIKVCPAYIIGEPHESEDDIQYGLEHLLRLKERKIDMDLPYISFLTPFPGTPLYDEYRKKGLLHEEDWDKYDGENVVVKCKCSKDKLIELRDRFYERFYHGE